MFEVEDVEDVACSGDDMKTRSFTMFLSVGMVLRRENKGSGYELMGESRIQAAQGCVDRHEADSHE